MSNLNNFNTCPRCNTPNPLVAKYCFQCGTQLKSPDTPVVCSKCNTINTGRASYCKTCGNKLVGAGVTKTCPRCASTVDANSTICSKCGFSFSSVNMTYPVTGQPAEVGGATKTVKKGFSLFGSGKKDKVVAVEQPSFANQANAERPGIVRSNAKASAKGRFGGFMALILALAAAYFLLCIPGIPMPTANWGEKFCYLDGAATGGWDFIITKLVPNISNFGTFTVFDYCLLGVLALAALTIVVEAISGLVQLFTGVAAKKGKVLLLIVTILTGLAVGFVNLCQYGTDIVTALGESSLVGMFNFFTGLYSSSFGVVRVGWVFNLIPAYMLLAYIFSLITKPRKGKEIPIVGR